ncbi:MAG: protein phosphatase 2C domain-containing protein [Pirellulaceae bacterium]
MREAKNTQRALVRIGFDGRVHKTFRGPKAESRFENEVRVLKYLEQRDCPFVPRLLASNSEKLEIVTSNCGAIVESVSDEKAAEVFAELEQYGVRHEDPFPRNITYRAQDGRFCAIDFEFASILDELQEDASESGGDVSVSFDIGWSGQTDRGKFRPNNEDAFLALRINHSGIQYLGKTGSDSTAEGEFVFAVSDGMGGADSGEFASRIALDAITTRLPGEYAVRGDSSYPTETLKDLFERIHAAMIWQGKCDPNCRDMGATLTLLWFRRRRAYFAHIGDSRLYKLSPRGLEQLSEDHTHVGWLRRSGAINEREARQHPRKNVLNQALGAGHQFLKPEVGSIAIEPDESFLLCTDGVIEGLWDQRIERIVREKSWEKVAEALVSGAVEESGRDNATALYVHPTARHATDEV